MLYYMRNKTNETFFFEQNKGVDFTIPGAPPRWGRNCTVVPAVAPAVIPLPSAEDLSDIVSDLTNGAPVSFESISAVSLENLIKIK
jgi:hypothetical protein